jgi:hypothetical protein
MNMRVINKGSRRPGKIVAQCCCWWIYVGYFFNKD